MARRIANKFPQDQTPSRALGLSLPFSGAGDAVFKSNYSTQDQIKNNLINFFLTNKGERVMQPNFGANLREFVFEQIESPSLDLLKKRIQDSIKEQFPLVQILEVVVSGNEDYNVINCNITYTIVNFGIEDQININFA